MRANRLESVQGLRWVVEGLRVVRAAPLRLLVLNFAFLFAISVAVAIPLIGFALVWLLIPAFVVGPHAISRAAAAGTPPDLALLVSGFRIRLPSQLRLGGVFLAAMILVLAATVLADDGRFAQAMIGHVRLEVDDLLNPDVRRAMMIGAGLQTAALTALWYAPLLVAWDGLPVSKAIFFSTTAAWINWRALLAYGVAMTLLFAFVLMLALGAAIFFSGGGAASGNVAFFAAIWTMLPIWFATSYLSYRDVFAAAETAAG